MTSSVSTPYAAVLSSAVLLAACGGGGDGGSSVFDNGTLAVSITDAPACGYDAVNVTVQRVRVHRDAGAGEGDSGWVDIVPDAPKRIDLLTLTNGTLEALGQTRLQAGRYTQLRLVLAENSAAQPLANAVTPTGGSETALDTPSALQSGLKIPVQIDVAADQVADVAIDFDACASVVPRGNSGRYNLKPVIAAIPVLSDAGQRVVGHLPAALAGASVSLQAAGVPVRTTPADATGRFVLHPVPAGSYDLVVVAPGRVNAVVTGVPVSATAVTTLGSDTARLDPPASASRQASGTAAIAGSTAVPAASVRARQTVSGTPVSIDVQPVDADNGTWRFTLATAAPVKTPYVAGATGWTWTPDEAAAARYRLEATAEGRATQQADIYLGAGDTTTTIVFP